MARKKKDDGTDIFPEDAIEKIQTNDYVIKLDYPFHEVEAKLLATTLLKLNTVLVELNSQYPELPRVKLVVKAHKPESFDIIYFLEWLQHSQIGEAINWLTDSEQKRWLLDKIGWGLITVFGICKFSSKGKIVKIEPKKEENSTEDTVDLVNDNNEVITVSKRAYDAFKNSKLLKSAVGSMFQHFEKEPSLRSVEFKMSNPDGPIEKIQNNEFSTLAKLADNNPQDKSDKYEYFNNQTLTAIKVAFKGTSTWTMIWNGEEHKFKIEKEILKHLQSSRIGQRDKIIVDIKITEKYNEEYGVYLRSIYEITELHQFIALSDEEPSLPKTE